MYIQEGKDMNQEQTPVLEMLDRFRKKNRGYFNIPAHHFETGISEKMKDVLGEKAYGIDVTETDGTDDLHCPEEAIEKAQKLAADLYGSDECWFLVNGSTCGNEAMVLSAAGPGEKIIISRDAHKSVLMGLILSGAHPIWIYPEFAERESPTAIITPGLIKKACAEHPDAKAVFLTSPSYYGICQPLKEIADICHGFGMPLLVDEAHGGHFRFHEAFPDDALSSGADVVVQSTHKTSGSLTQTSLLHLHSDLISRDRIDQSLKLVQSTSPSYVLMSSLDAARNQMAVNGRDLMDKAIKTAEYIRNGLRTAKGVYVFDEFKDRDPLRIAVSLRKTGIDGFRFQRLLFEKNITTEMADINYVLIIVSWGTTRDEADKLLEAVRRIASLRSSGKTKKEMIPSAEETYKVFRTEQRTSPREAWFSKKKKITLYEAENRIAGEMIVPYPPGIPAIYPGEVITEEIIRYLDKLRCLGASFHGVNDTDNMEIYVTEQP